MSSETLKLEKKIIINGKIEALTGLHIGGSSIGLAIGGADSVVVRNSLNNIPYIPGSSLKGKMRCLLEKMYGLVKIEEKDNKFSGKSDFDTTKEVVQMFGFAADNQEGVDEKCAPTRLIFRDAMLSKESIDALSNAENTDMYLTEIKTETNIDRLTSAANPRQIERVPAGAEFNFEIVLDIYNNDEEREKEFIKILKQGIGLVENDYIGGSGSRGYGQIKFKDINVMVKTNKYYLEGKDDSAENKEIVDMLKSCE